MEDYPNEPVRPQRRKRRNSFLLVIILLILLIGAATSGAALDRMVHIKPLDYLVQKSKEAGLQIPSTNQSTDNVKLLNEENVVIDVAEKVSPSVVTVSIQTPQRRVMQFNPFGGGMQQRIQGGEQQDIGSGFIVTADGTIVTNKHVVSDTSAKYKVITKDDKEFEVTKISRDPNNDLAILKIDASGLTPIELGDSSNLKVGQFAIAIGTALGEFRHTVTTGVISGLGRGITAGSEFQGSVEKLDDVIQTDAAINPGNSGGPLLNSAGQVIGVNVAVAQGAQGIGFALPVNILKDALSQFNANGSFAQKAYLGVEYQMVTQQSAILNNVPQGAYVQTVISGSPADKSGIKEDDIITKIDGDELKGDNGLANIIAKKKSGQQVQIEVWRDGKTEDVTATLEESPEQ
jgi:serine protease Do